MIPKKLENFMSKLQESTERDELVWREGADNSYFCDHKNHTLYIREHFDPDREISLFAFRISTNGKVTSFTVTDIEYDYESMKNMYEAIMVNANKVEDDLADFFD